MGSNTARHKGWCVVGAPQEPQLICDVYHKIYVWNVSQMVVHARLLEIIYEMEYPARSRVHQVVAMTSSRFLQSTSFSGEQLMKNQYE